MLVYPSGLDVSSTALRFLSARLREHRHRYVTEAVEVLAALAPTLAEAVQAASMKAFVLLDRDAAADRPNRRRPSFLLG
ncbi:hypothetical protein RKD37_001085 [Streptomyces ambofaciens]